MGCCHSAHTAQEGEDEQGEQQIDIRFSATSEDGTERNTRSTVRQSQPRPSADLVGPAALTGRYGSSRGVPSPSLSSVSLVPVARTGSYDVRVASRTRQNGGDGVIETSRLVVDHLKGNVFINQYLIIKDLGKGAHGTVKLVYNTQDDMLYAMKVIHKRRMRRQSYLAEPRAIAAMMRNVGASPLSQSQTEGQRGLSPLSSPRTPNGMTDEYSNEIAVMKELDHPNVVKLYEVIHDPSNNKLLMTMEYVEGGCVLAGSSPTQKVPIPEATAVKYFRDVVKGLEYLHFNRIVHGDLKPDNLLMSSSGKVKISDFGSARFCEKSDMIFATAGTPSFMAPEMCQGKPFNGFPGDIWALGICLYMFVFGKPPFTGNTTYQIYESIQRGELLFPPEIPVTSELKDLLCNMLTKDPADRMSLEEIPTHPWVTRGGALPVLQTSNERAVQRVFEAMRKRNESGAKRPAPSTVPLAAPPEPVDFRKLVPDAEVRHFKDGEVIITQGQLPEGLYYVQEGFVDMLLMPSEKKLVADEDFADAIDDDEDEEDEAVVTATANALDCRRSPGSGNAGEGEDGSGGDEGGDDIVEEEEEEGEVEPQKGVDGFMALFGARLSDRVSPLGSSSTMTPRNPSIVTPRHGSQTLLARNHSASVAPRYGSQSLGMQRSSNPNCRVSFNAPVSASMPLPPALHPTPSYYQPQLPPHLSAIAAQSPTGSRSPNQHAARAPSPPHSGHAASSPTGTPRQDSQTTQRVTSQLGAALAMANGGGVPAGTPPPAAATTTSAGGAGITTQLSAPVMASGHSRISLNGGVQVRVPSHSSVPVPGLGHAPTTTISPSPLGLSRSNAADVFDGQGTDGGADTDRSDTPPIGPGFTRPSQRATGSAREGVQAQPPSFVPSPPHLSPSTSRRTLVQEPSFNQRVSRLDSGHRQPSRLSLTNTNTDNNPSASAPGRVALQTRAVSIRARAPTEADEGGSSGLNPAGNTSRRIVSARGRQGSFGGMSLPLGSALSAIGGGNGSSGGGSKSKPDPEDDLLFLSPVESRRLSVTAGGAASFRRLGGAGIIVGASPPSGPPGAVSPAGSISRVQSTDCTAAAAVRPAGIPPAVEEVLADAEGESGKAGSNDSLISNADISMHAPNNKAGWRRERPAPLQVGSFGGSSSALPGGVIEQLAANGGALAHQTSGDVDGGEGGMSIATVVQTPGAESPRPVPRSKSIGRLRTTMRRSATHSNILQPASSGGAVIISGGGPPEGHDAARCQEEDREEGGAEDSPGGLQGNGYPVGRGVTTGQMRHAMTDVERMRQDMSVQGGHAYASAQPLMSLPSPGDRVRVRRHSTSSDTAGYMLNRILGVSMGGAPLDRSSIQEWSTTSKLAQKAIQRSDSMHSRMAQMVLRAKQHAVRRKRRGSMQLITTRGPGSVVGELCIDGKPTASPSTVVAKGPVTVLLIKNEKVNKYRNQPSVMAALHRSQNASLVQEAMERFVECEQEVVAVEVIRRTITTEPNLHLGEVAGDEYGVEPHSSERLMADIYNG